MWLSFCERPLTIEELNEAVILEESCTDIDEDDKFYSPNLLLEICHGIVHYDKGLVVLAHFSVKTFLTSDWIKTSHAASFALDRSNSQAQIGRLCLTYLKMDAFSKTLPTHTAALWDSLEKYPLLDYASHYWPIHTSASGTTQNDELINAFFETGYPCGGANFSYWVLCLLPEKPISLIQATSPLYFAASFGLVSVIEYLANKHPDIDLDAQGGRYGLTPLLIACRRERTKVVGALLKLGASPDARRGYHAAFAHVVNPSGRTGTYDLVRLRHELGLDGFRKSEEVQRIIDLAPETPPFQLPFIGLREWLRQEMFTQKRTSQKTANQASEFTSDMYLNPPYEGFVAWKTR